MAGTDAVPDAQSSDASRFVQVSGLVVDEVTPTTLEGHADLGEDHLTA